MNLKTSFLLICSLLLAMAYGSHFFYKDSFFPKKRLRVLTYSSFAGLYGPGRFLQKEFEVFCDCKIEWFIAEDSSALRQRLLILPSIDVVIGFDQLSLVNQDGFKWKNLSALQKPFHKEMDQWKGEFFMPIDWAPIGFLFKNSNENIKKLKNLHKVKSKISFPEPTSSTLGLQLYYWIYEVFLGDMKKVQNFLKKMKSKIYGPVFSWSLAYGYFQKGRVSMSLSYLSSLIYHFKEEQDSSYQFSYFEEGHPYQVEFAAVPESCTNCEWAYQFVEFLLSSPAQKLIRDKNYMFSVLKDEKPLLELKNPTFISYNRVGEFIKNKKNLLKIWKESLY